MPRAKDPIDVRIAEVNQTLRVLLKVVRQMDLRLSKMETGHAPSMQRVRGKQRFGTVTYLTTLEYADLCKKHGQGKADAIIRFFDDIKREKGYTYRSDALALERWGIRAFHEAQTAGTVSGPKESEETAADNDEESRLRGGVC